MTQFDQRGQQVEKQYNAGHDITFGAVQTPVDFIATLEQLQNQIAQAGNTGMLGEDAATNAQYQITKALQQAKSPSPDKKTLGDHLAAAKTVLENIAATGGLVTALTGAIEVVQKLF